MCAQRSRDCQLFVVFTVILVTRIEGYISCSYPSFTSFAAHSLKTTKRFTTVAKCPVSWRKPYSLGRSNYSLLLLKSESTTCFEKTLTTKQKYVGNEFSRLLGTALLTLSITFGTVGVVSASDVTRPLDLTPMQKCSPELSTCTPDTQQLRMSMSKSGTKYWSIQNDGTYDERVSANLALMDHIVGTINTMFYDRTAGAQFTPSEFYSKWRNWYRNDPMAQQTLSTREGTVKAIRNVLLQNLPDHFAKFLTRDELYAELSSRNDGFLGLGAIVEAPGSNPFFDDPNSSMSKVAMPVSVDVDTSLQFTTQFVTPKVARWKLRDSLTFLRHAKKENQRNNMRPSHYYMTADSVKNAPVITGVVPYSPAERAGLTVGDRIIAVQDDSFLMLSRNQVAVKLKERYSLDTNQYFGFSELTVAKPVLIYKVDGDITSNQHTVIDHNSDSPMSKAVVQAFRPVQVRLPTIMASERMTSFSVSNQDNLQSFPTSVNEMRGIKTVSLESSDNFSPQSTRIRSGGNNIVRWQLLEDNEGSIFLSNANVFHENHMQQLPQRVENDVSQLTFMKNDDEGQSNFAGKGDNPSLQNSAVPNDEYISNSAVGYVRLTRFSRTAADGFVKAVQELENLGAHSYIIDLRNNYGGVIQFSMILASTLLRDPHDVLCYTMNSRGGFTPHDVEEYVVDRNYPGYLLSLEPMDATINQVRKENPSFLEDDGWSPPSAYASLREQSLKRGINKGIRFTSHDQDFTNNAELAALSSADLIRLQQKEAQKPIVILVNEGTASSAEVFASALRDNGRTVALVGAKTYGKGLIQHTFPLPDGSALRLTVAEYLTPKLQHVSKIGRAQFHPVTGEWVGGGIEPDIYCDSKHGIPSNIGADLCVGVALDVLKEYDQTAKSSGISPSM